jgi:5-methylcytosine-specific restriction endonuclease McrA
MKTILALQNVNRFATRLKNLHNRRKGLIVDVISRQSPTPHQRNAILSKTGSRCHICGGRIETDDAWQVDHLVPHAVGGDDLIENYLPAHSMCNNYRWHYSPEEFQWILKLGIWMRTRIEKHDRAAMALAERFVKDERARITRQNNS